MNSKNANTWGEKNTTAWAEIYAFTLVELSIVLVILGLLVGGVLAGQSLIKSASIRAQVSQIQEYQLALNAFRLKYSEMPGDLSNATKFFGATDVNGNTITDGNGNGYIDTDSGVCFDDMAPCGGDRWGDSHEMNNVFQQLALAQLITFNPTDPDSNGPIGVSLPALKLNPAAGFFIGAAYNMNVPTGITARTPETNNMVKGKNWMWMLACHNLASTDVLGTWDNQCAVFTPVDTFNMDTKMDDGKPLTGKFISFSGGGPSPYDNCVTGSDYDVSRETLQCQSTYQMN